MKTGIAAAVAAACMWGLASGAAAQALPPVEAFGDLPFLSQPQLSPDGKHFAGIQSLDGKPAAVIYTIGQPGPPQVFASSNWIVSHVTWAKNDRLIMFTKTVRSLPLGYNPDLYTWYRALSLEVGTQNWVQLFDRNNDSVGMNTSTALVLDKFMDNPDSILMPLWTREKNERFDNDVTAGMMGSNNNFRFSLYRVDVRTGRAVVIEDGSPRGAYWLTDGEGGIVGRVDTTVTPLVDHLYLNNDGSFRNVRNFDGRPDSGLNIIGLTYDGKSLAVAAVNAAGRDYFRRMDRATGADGDALVSDDAYDVAGGLYDDWTGRLVGAIFLRDRPDYVYFDPALRDLQTGIEQAFPGQNARAVSTTRDGGTAIVTTESPTQPRTYYFLNRATHQASRIVSEYPNLSAADLGEMKPYPYKARDGLDIPAYITLPPKKTAKMLPLVVMPHGGPDSRDYIHFDWWAQFLANRGYAVFQPNYRGSDGYGYAFNSAGFHQWGLKMQDDITDGVKKLIADGIVDPKRVCIVGASYGGYAALAGATFTPEMYACAVSIAGVSHLRRMLQMEERMYGKNSGTVAFWAKRIGTESEDGERIDATSPALHADRVQAPVLLMHGRKDTTVLYDQTELELEALQRAGKQVELVTFDADDHYLTLPETRITMLRSLETFLAKHIGR